MPAPSGPRYRVDHLLGSGSLSAVYLAFDRLLRRPVALKKFHRTPDRPGSLQREFRLLSRFQHPHIVEVLDLHFPDHAPPILAMEFLRGPSLRDFMDRSRGGANGSNGDHLQRKELAARLEMVLGTAAGLRALHSRRVLHGDLKPTNILFRNEADGTGAEPNPVCLVDFGLSRSFRATRKGEFSGTYRYSSPEQIAGEELDARSDLFSLGLILFELLTARHPYDLILPVSGEIDFSLLLHLRPSQTNPRIPKDIDQIVRRLMHPRRENRYPRAGDLIADILSRFPVLTASGKSSPASWLHFQFGLAGREREFRKIRSRIRTHFRNGRGTGTVIVGSTGSGKGRLLHHLQQDAKADLIPTICVSGLSAAGGESSLVGRILGQLSLLESGDDGLRLPVVGRRRSILPARKGIPLLAGQAEGERFARWKALSESLIRFVETDPARRLLLVVERLEAAPVEFHDLMIFLLSRLGDHPVSLLASWDTDEASGRESPGFPGRIPPECRVRLQPLTDGTVRRILQSRRIRIRRAGEFARTAIRKTGGNFLLLEEYLEDCLRQGALRRGIAGWTLDDGRLPDLKLPRSLSEVYRRKYARLDRQDRSLLRSLCVLGTQWEKPHLIPALEPEIPRLETRLERLCRAGIIRRRPAGPGRNESYFLVLPGLRGRFSRGVPRRSRRDLNRKFAQSLDSLRPGRPELDPLIGQHFWEAGSPNGIPHLLRAGMKYLRACDIPAAETMIRRALDLNPPPPVRRILNFRLGEWAILRGDYSRGLRYLRPLVRLLPADRREICPLPILFFRIAEAYEKSGDLARAELYLRRCRTELRRRPRKELKFLGFATRARVMLRRGEVAKAIRILKKVKKLAPPLAEPRLTAEIEMILGGVHLRLGETAEAAAAYRRSILLLKPSGNLVETLRAYNGLASTYESNRPGRAGTILRRAEALARRSGVPRIHGAILTNLCRTYLSLGDWELARDAARSAVEIFHRLRLPDISRPLLVLGNIHRIQGDFETARDCFRRATAACRGNGMHSTRILIAVNQSLLDDAEGFSGRALRQLEGHRSRLPRAGAPVRSAYLLQAAHLHMKRDRMKRALRLLDDARQLIRRMNSLSHAAQEHLLRARWLEKAGRPDEALAELEASRRAAEKRKDPYQSLLAGREIRKLQSDSSQETGSPCREQDSDLPSHLKVWIGDQPMSSSRNTLLQHLEKLAGLFRSFRDYDTLLEQTLDCVIFLSGAERGFLFLSEENAGELRLVASRHSDRETIEDANQISRSILRGSLRQDSPTFSSDALRDRRFRNNDSVTRHQIRSFLCTPMWFEGKIIGTIYLDHRTAKKAFRDEDARNLFALASFVSPVIVHARQAGKLQNRIENLQEQMLDIYNFEKIIGKSRKLLRVFRLLEKVKDTNASVLILGESGTGKELLAQTIHLQGTRRLGPFAAVNCAAIPDTLIESELFGVTRGAATDVSERIGKFEEANGGTIFLDEVADLSANAQAKILRTLQEREIQRVGSNESIPLDVRVISATNRDLDALLVSGKFREDLYFRLNVIPIHLPPLRERIEDIPLLIRHFTEHFCRALHRKTMMIPKETIRSYQAYSWPGNVRELRNVIEREVILADTEALPPLSSDGRIPGLFQQSLDLGMEKRFSEDDLRRAYTRLVYENSGRNKRKTCGILGIDYKTLQKRLGPASPGRKRKQPSLPFSTRD